MCWIWSTDTEYVKWGADIDVGATSPMGGHEHLSNEPVDSTSGIPVYRSNWGMKKFRKSHSPPFSPGIVVDTSWQEIILKFVPADRVQFHPVRLIARGEVSDEFSWVIPFDRAKCIDIKRSEIFDMTDRPGFVRIWNMGKFYHVRGCLGSLHLARDEYEISHLLVSNELKEALTATGGGHHFWRPEEITDHSVH